MGHHGNAAAQITSKLMRVASHMLEAAEEDLELADGSVRTAIAAAVEDALRPLGIKVDGLPITPMRLRELIREATAGA